MGISRQHEMFEIRSFHNHWSFMMENHYENWLIRNSLSRRAAAESITSHSTTSLSWRKEPHDKKHEQGASRTHPIVGVCLSSVGGVVYSTDTIVFVWALGVQSHHTVRLEMDRNREESDRRNFAWSSSFYPIKYGILIRIASLRYLTLVLWRNALHNVTTISHHTTTSSQEYRILKCIGELEFRETSYRPNMALRHRNFQSPSFSGKKVTQIDPKKKVTQIAFCLSYMWSGR